MLCDICKKNEATIHIKEIHGSEKKTLNLCGHCAAEQGKTAGFQFDPMNPLGMLINKIMPGAANPAAASPETMLVCPVCGWTPARIRESGGRLGCPQCYHTFERMIRAALENMQRGHTHFGKRPGAAAAPPPDDGAGRAAELERCRRELARLVAAEDYEQAAVIRDRIRELQESESEKPEDADE